MRAQRHLNLLDIAARSGMQTAVGGIGTDKRPHLVILGAGASKAACPKGDANGRLVPLQREIPRIPKVAALLKAAGECGNGEFEQTFDRLVRRNEHPQIVDDLKQVIRDYFARLQLPERVTEYDLLVMCLRGKDVIVSFNWDPLLIQALSRNAHLLFDRFRDQELVHELMPQSFYPHGCAVMGFCNRCMRKMASDMCANCRTPMQQPDLLYPVRSKDYASDKCIAREWTGIERTMALMYCWTVYGYSAPVGDAAALSMLSNAWKQNPVRDWMQFEVINRTPAQSFAAWKPMVVRAHYFRTKSLRHSSILQHPRRTCEALSAATLLLNPIPSNPVPPMRSLPDLHQWIQPLIDEEMEMMGRV